MAERFGAGGGQPIQSKRGAGSHWGIGGMALAVAILAVVAWLQAPHPLPGKPFAEKSLVEWVRYPLERNASLRLPSAPGALYGVASLDTQRVWAVGDGGAVLVTGDGGKTWQAQVSGVQTNLYAVRWAADGLRGWIVGSDGTILTSLDGGWRWVQLDAGTRANLNSVHTAADGVRAWAVGDGGTLLATIDGGRTWQTQVLAKGMDLYAVQMAADGLRGWVVGEGGTILATADGGKTWLTRMSGVRMHLLSMHMAADGLHGWAVGGLGTIVATADGGATWQVRGSGTRAHLLSVRMGSDGRHGWIAGANGTVLATTDGGASWHVQAGGAKAHLWAAEVAGADGSHAWVAGDGGTIQTTVNGGRGWEAQTSGVYAHLLSVHLMGDGTRAWAVGGSGVMLATANGGRSWSALPTGVEAHLRAVRMGADGQHGWAVGDGGVILASVDGGRSWRAQRSGVSTDLYAVTVGRDGSHGWAAGLDGTILATRDGGATWLPQACEAKADLYSIRMDPQAMRGWAVGAGGTIVATQDGGASWQRQHSPVDVHLMSVIMMADGLRAWAVGGAGTILVTADGGQTWQAQRSGISADLNSVRMAADGLRGWVAGDGGTLLTTTDGGQHWHASDSQVGSSRLSIAFSDDGLHGWAVGHPPALLKTHDGGITWSPDPFPLRYARYPAPWFWCVLSLFAVGLAGAARRRWHASAQLTAPSPTRPVACDPADVSPRPMAQGVSRFLRHPQTEAPLTLGLFGAAGAGKTALMRGVCADLRSHGVITAWFDARLHEGREPVSAALLDTLRAIRVPCVWSSAGWQFRLRLLWLRARRHEGAVAGALAICAALLAHFAGSEADEWRKLGLRLGLGGVGPVDAIDSLNAVDLGKLLLQGSGAAFVGMTLWRGLRVFHRFSLGSWFLQGKTYNVRQREVFAEQFETVTHALRHPLVLAIDDLDHCSAETWLEVADTVAFLKSSGRCAVMIAADPVHARTMLAGRFESLAKDWAALYPDAQEISGMHVGANTSALDRQHQYATEYLERLFDLELAVPACDRTGFLHTSVLQHVANGRGQLLRLWLLWLGAIAVGFGLIAARILLESPMDSFSAKVTALAPQRVANPGPQAEAGDRKQVPVQIVRRYVPEVQPGQDAGNPLWLYVGIVFVAVIASGAYAMRSRDDRKYDSFPFPQVAEDILPALRIWGEYVGRKRASPRAVRRFEYRVRYLASLRHSAPLPASDREPESTSHANLAPLSLAAFVALQFAYGKDWRSMLIPFSAATMDRPLREAIEAWQGLTHRNWPPTPDELDAFDRLLR